MKNTLRAVLAISLVASSASVGSADEAAPDLARYFGWDEPRIIVVDRGAGPALASDFNADGLMDLACVNNSKSRIELHVQRKTPRTDQEIERGLKANQLPPSKWYDRVEVSVQHRVRAFRAYDIDRDGKLDIVYAGQPQELVILRQSGELSFEVLSKRRVTDLSAGQDGLEIANVMGDEAPELLAGVGGRINIYGLSESAVTGEPLVLGSGGTGQEIAAFFIEDYNGDGLLDISSAVPEDASPVRLWLQERAGESEGSGGKQGQLGPETRFELPALRELEPIRFPGMKAASLAVIERASRRIVVNDLKIDGDAPASAPAARPGSAERDANAEVFTFPGPANKARAIIAADIDGDGLADLLATDQQANTIVMYRQAKSIGVGNEQRFSALKDPKALAAGQWDSSPSAEVFVLSEADKVVGVSTYDGATGRLGFPQPIALATAGASPVAMCYAGLKSGPALAVIARDKRDHTLEMHRPGDSAPVTLKLEGVNRPPQSMLVGDFDHDGSADLVLFTPSEPLVMVRSIEGAAEEMKVLTDKLMPQFGLVQAAGPDNTAMLDVNGDGFDELLVADQNFVRACEFSSEKGWRVVEQITMPEASAALVGLTVLPAKEAASSTIVAFDKSNKRLVLMSRTPDKGWSVTDRLRFSAFDVTQLRGGSFTGDSEPTILAISDGAFGVVRLGGGRYDLEEIAAFRSDAEDRLEHEIEAGDLNSDGFVDMVVLDAKEQMCQVFTFSKGRALHLATEFKVFETRQFSRGEEREYEPSAAIIADLTGDGRNDLTLQVHDRLIVYPQMAPGR